MRRQQGEGAAGPQDTFVRSALMNSVTPTTKQHNSTKTVRVSYHGKFNLLLARVLYTCFSTLHAVYTYVTFLTYTYHPPQTVSPALDCRVEG